MTNNIIAFAPDCVGNTVVIFALGNKDYYRIVSIQDGDGNEMHKDYQVNLYVSYGKDYFYGGNKVRLNSLVRKQDLLSISSNI